MPEVKIATKELKNVLKTFSKFSAKDFRKFPTVSMDVNPFCMLLALDHTIIRAQPEAINTVGDKSSFHFNPDILQKIALYGKETTLKWESGNPTLNLSNSRVNTNLNVAVARPDYAAIENKIDSYSNIPLEALHIIVTALSIPFSYFKGKKDLMPVHLYSENGKLMGMADDGFSLAKVETTLDISELDIKVPKYIMDALYKEKSKNSNACATIGMDAFRVLLNNESISVYTASMNEVTSNFDNTYKEISGDWLTSFEFVPSLLIEATKPLISIIPDKDKDGTILEMEVGDIVRASIKHNEVGSGEVSEIEGISNIYNENFLKKVAIQHHPQAFLDYTELLPFDSAKCFANNKAVYYETIGKKEWGDIKIKYLFPTISN